MMTMTYNRRQGLSLLLVLSMIFTMWLTVSPMNHADAGILSAVGNVAKSIFVNVGALAGGALTAVVGAAIGGGSHLERMVVLAAKEHECHSMALSRGKGEICRANRRISQSSGQRQRICRYSAGIASQGNGAARRMQKGGRGS